MSLTSSGVNLNLLVAGPLGWGNAVGWEEQQGGGGEVGGAFRYTMFIVAAGLLRHLSYQLLFWLTIDNLSCVSLAYNLYNLRLKPARTFMCWIIGDNYPRAGRESS